MLVAVKPKLAILSHSELKNKNAFCDDTKVFQSHVRQSYCRIIILHGHSTAKCRMMDRSRGYAHVPVARVHVFNCLNNFIPCRELLSAYHQMIIPKLSSLNGHYCFCYILSRDATKTLNFAIVIRRQISVAKCREIDGIYIVEPVAHALWFTY